MNLFPHAKNVIDKEAALKRLGGDEKLLKTLAEFFLEDAPTLMKQLVSGFQEKDFDLVHHRAHSLKGLSATFDALLFRQLAEETEGLARVRNELVLGEKINELRIEFDRVVACLHELIQAAVH